MDESGARMSGADVEYCTAGRKRLLTCPLSHHGYSRSSERGNLQIVCGLPCYEHGCLVVVEVFNGNAADPATLGKQIDKLRRLSCLSRVVLLGDRGTFIEARNHWEDSPSSCVFVLKFARSMEDISPCSPLIRLRPHCEVSECRAL